MDTAAALARAFGLPPEETPVQEEPETVPILQAWDLWARVSRNLAASTIRKYTAYLEDLQDFASPIEELTADQVRSWIETRGGKPASVAGRLCAARSLYGWLLKTEQRDTDPMARLDRPRVPKGLPHPTKNLPTLLEALSPEFRAVAVFISETGVRISEAWSLDVPPPCPDELIILGKGSKERWIPVSDAARAALDSLGGRMPGAQRTFQKALQAHGTTPHKLRHLFATELAEADVDVLVIQRLLGHASVATTQIYADVSKRRLREGIARRKDRQ